MIISLTSLAIIRMLVEKMRMGGYHLFMVRKELNLLCGFICQIFLKIVILVLVNI